MVMMTGSFISLVSFAKAVVLLRHIDTLMSLDGLE
jgi:hypothetical protein